MKHVFSPCLKEVTTHHNTSSSRSSLKHGTYLKNFERIRSAKINSRLNTSTHNNGSEYINNESVVKGRRIVVQPKVTNDESVTSF
jgi:hypothetical protein